MNLIVHARPSVHQENLHLGEGWGAHLGKPVNKREC